MRDAAEAAEVDDLWGKFRGCMAQGTRNAYTAMVEIAQADGVLEPQVSARPCRCHHAFWSMAVAWPQSRSSPPAAGGAAAGAFRQEQPKGPQGPRRRCQARDEAPGESRVVVSGGEARARLPSRVGGGARSRMR